MSVERKAEFSEDDENDTIDDEYFKGIRELNESFLKWFQDYFSQNPHYIFTPVCKEYIQYVESLNAKFGLKQNRRGRPRKRVASPVVDKPKVNDKIAVNNVAESGSSSQSSSQDSQQKSSQPLSEKREFITSTPTQSTSSSNSGLFNFGSDSKRSKLELSAKSMPGPEFFAMTKSNLDSIPEAKKNEEAAAENEDDEYHPPKPESNAVIENDCVYSKRCKLFYKKEKSFVEKGIGILYVKSQPDNKYQLLIRTDTTVGNILLNIQLHPSLPLLSSKKGVLLTCVPNPPLSAAKDDQSLVTFFIRVKNDEDAKDLLNKLSEYASKVEK